MARFARSTPRAVLPLGDLRASKDRRDTQVGALARALRAAERLGVVVPDTFVVVADVFRQVVHSLPPGHDPGALIRTIHRSSGVERAARARERVLVATLDSDLEREIDGAFGALSEAAPWGLAVRSSALVADTAIARAAGLAETSLALRNREDLGRCIRETWALAFSESTLAYLRARRIRDVAVAVLVQPVVVAHRSVSLFTDVPAAPGPQGESRVDAVRSRLIVAVPGLGGGGTDVSRAEIVRIDRDGTVLSRRDPSPQRRRVVRGASCTWAPPEASAEKIPRERLAELGELARRLDGFGPSEIRCVLPKSGEATVVDVIPLEPGAQPGSGTAQTLWGRVLVGEAPPGPMTPLSQHLVIGPSLERARRVLGDEAPRSSRLAGSIVVVDGRPYIDLSLLLERTALTEADGPARLEVAGAQWTPDLVRDGAARPGIARVGLRLAQVATEQRALADEVARFERDAEQERRWLAEMDLAILPDDALTTTLHEVRDFLVRVHRLAASASATAVSGHSLVASVLSAAEPSRATWLAYAVTAGADVVTARLPAAFCHVASILRLDGEGRAAVEGGATVLNDVPSGPFRRALERFLEAYGDRGLAEGELSAPRWREEPGSFFLLLQAALRGPPIDPDVLMARARAGAAEALAALEPNLSFFEIRLLRDLVVRQRELLRLRERCRVRLAHGLALMRTVALDVDRRIRRLDGSLEPGSALLLTLDELAGAVRHYRTDLGPIVDSRRRDLARNRRKASPPPAFRGSPRPPGLDSSAPLRGLAVSPGVVEGTAVRVGPGLEGLERFAPGDVLVLESLDLGLAPLLLEAGAVVAELGTPLSSAAVVARDVGVPAVTGVSFATATIRDGERIRVDADTGTVERVNA